MQDKASTRPNAQPDGEQRGASALRRSLTEILGVRLQCHDRPILVPRALACSPLSDAAVRLWMLLVTLEHETNIDGGARLAEHLGWQVGDLERAAAELLGAGWLGIEPLMPGPRGAAAGQVLVPRSAVTR